MAEVRQTLEVPITSNPREAINALRQAREGMDRMRLRTNQDRMGMAQLNASASEGTQLVIALRSAILRLAAPAAILLTAREILDVSLSISRSADASLQSVKDFQEIRSLIVASGGDVEGLIDVMLDIEIKMAEMLIAPTGLTTIINELPVPMQSLLNSAGSASDVFRILVENNVISDELLANLANQFGSTNLAKYVAGIRSLPDDIRRAALGAARLSKEQLEASKRATAKFNQEMDKFKPAAIKLFLQINQVPAEIWQILILRQIAVRRTTINRSAPDLDNKFYAQNFLGQYKLAFTEKGGTPLSKDLGRFIHWQKLTNGIMYGVFADKSRAFDPLDIEAEGSTYVEHYKEYQDNLKRAMDTARAALPELRQRLLELGNHADMLEGLYSITDGSDAEYWRAYRRINQLEEDIANAERALAVRTGGALPLIDHPIYGLLSADHPFAKRFVALQKTLEGIAQRVRKSVEETQTRIDHAQRAADLALDYMEREWDLLRSNLKTGDDSPIRTMDEIIKPSLELLHQQIGHLEEITEDTRAVGLLHSEWEARLKSIDKSVQGIATTISSGITGVLTQAITAAEAATNLVNKLLDNLTRTYIADPLSQFLTTAIGTFAGSFLGGSQAAGPQHGGSVYSLRASGGPVASNVPYVVGELGPETFSRSGYASHAKPRITINNISDPDNARSGLRAALAVMRGTSHA